MLKTHHEGEVLITTETPAAWTLTRTTDPRENQEVRTITDRAARSQSGDKEKEQVLTLSKGFLHNCVHSLDFCTPLWDLNVYDSLYHMTHSGYSCVTVDNPSPCGLRPPKPDRTPVSVNPQQQTVEQVCHTRTGTSHLYWYLTLVLLAPHTCTGTSNWYWYITLVPVHYTDTGTSKSLSEAS